MSGVTLISRIPLISAEMERKASAVVSKTVADIKANAQGRVPVDTGALKNSISSRAEALSGEVFTGMEYAEYVEYGTSRMAGRPYMIPAAEQARAGFIAAMKRIV